MSTARALAAAPEQCRDARRGLAFYVAKMASWSPSVPLVAKSERFMPLVAARGATSTEGRTDSSAPQTEVPFRGECSDTTGRETRRPHRRNGDVLVAGSRLVRVNAAGAPEHIDTIGTEIPATTFPPTLKSSVSLAITANTSLSRLSPASTVAVYNGEGIVGDARPVTSTSGDTASSVPKSLKLNASCSQARRGLRWYVRVTEGWRVRMGARGQALPPQVGAAASCSRVRQLAKAWRAKARNARLRYERWYEHEYAWWKWLPDKFARVGACETGYGKRPGSWTWDSGTYVSAFGIYRPAYEAYHRWTGHNSPREQYEVAAAIQSRYGWGAWGCGGA